MPEGPIDLRELSKTVCFENGAVAFGVVPAEAAQKLPNVKVEWTIGRETADLRSVLQDAKSVIVFGIESRDDTHEQAVFIADEDYEYPGYARLNMIRRRLVEFLRGEGYEAVFPYEVDSLTSFKRLVQMAGIGAFGKNSLIISPDFGPWLRFGVVFTDADLEPDGPFEEDLCGDCDECVRACPAGAITPYVVDPGRCLVGLLRGERTAEENRETVSRFEPQLTSRTHVMCTRCQLVCPHTSDERRAVAISSDNGD